MIICFAGHSSIPSRDKVKELVKEQVRRNVSCLQYVTCYLGGMVTLITYVLVHVEN